MEPVRAALYLDFDNVFGALLKLDPDAALVFAEKPGLWLRKLRTELTVDGRRRWVVARCYMNPSGSVANPNKNEDNPRLFFSRFRPFFVQAGFEVVDCPRLTLTKNAADIRLVVDAMDALRASSRYDEFVIASGDSDMTPLLYRLRADDRRTTVISASDAAEVLSSVPDRFIDSRQLLDVIAGEPVDDEDAIDMAPSETVLIPWDTGTIAASVVAPIAVAGNDDPDFLETAATASLAATEEWSSTAPEPVKRVTQLLNTPRIPRDFWPPLYEVLAEYARTHKFNLTEATRWSRDRLVGEGLRVSRSAVAYVVRGTAFGGAPLYRLPPPTASEIGQALLENIKIRANAAGLELTEEENRQLEEWLSPGAPA